MRNWDAEREKPKVTRQYGLLTIRGPLKPYNELVDALGAAAKRFSDTRSGREGMRRLAWFLGELGETHACESIMEYAQEPEYVETHWGYVRR